MFQEIPRWAPEGIREEIPKVILERNRIPKDIPKGIPREIPKEFPKGRPRQIPERMPKADSKDSKVFLEGS